MKYQTLKNLESMYQAMTFYHLQENLEINMVKN